ncbi:PrgI family protein [[Clostridium] fimetarium]|uniref:PrgI family protein n=1 Tax=[Clostridium] fimetarium TaxID=99656 RepID=A0A1I0MAJ3_9FIRM|nr:PrgI family protein [[Clostridium] fimetarium]SEV85128.1 PrgI family protein [[Clostridium] fimetarium]
MVIEVNKDVDRYQESVAFGLSAKQLIFSAASLISGSGIVLLLYPYIGITGSAYVAIPVVAPIALGGFYSYNGMSFYNVMQRKLHMMFGNKALVYVSTESEASIKTYQVVEVGKCKKSVRPVEQNQNKKQEEFEAMKKKMKSIMIGCIAAVALAVAGTVVYKIFH